MDRARLSPREFRVFSTVSLPRRRSITTSWPYSGHISRDSPFGRSCKPCRFPQIAPDLPAYPGTSGVRSAGGASGIPNRFRSPGPNGLMGSDHQPLFDKPSKVAQQLAPEACFVAIEILIGLSTRCAWISPKSRATVPISLPSSPEFCPLYTLAVAGWSKAKPPRICFRECSHVPHPHQSSFCRSTR